MYKVHHSMKENPVCSSAQKAKETQTNSQNQKTNHKTKAQKQTPENKWNTTQERHQRTNMLRCQV